MIIREIVATCSNPHVARAAVASIGGDFARQFARAAAARRLSSGMLASRLVRDFARRAGDGDWEGLGKAIRDADTPILDGLRHILQRGLEFGKEGPFSVLVGAARPRVGGLLDDAQPIRISRRGRGELHLSGACQCAEVGAFSADVSRAGLQHVRA